MYGGDAKSSVPKVPVKKLFLALEMAAQVAKGASGAYFKMC